MPPPLRQRALKCFRGFAREKISVERAVERMAKEWIFPEKTADESVIGELCRAFGIPALVARVLAVRP